MYDGQQTCFDGLIPFLRGIANQLAAAR